MKIISKSILAACAIPSALLFGSPAQAQEAYVGQIIFMGSTYCPAGTLPADGSLLPVVQFEALFSLFSNRFGGDGVNNFALPAIPSPLSGTRYCVVFNGFYPIRPSSVVPPSRK